MADGREERRQAAARWLAEAAAAENQRFLGELITVRDRPAPAGGGDDCQEPKLVDVLPQAMADAHVENGEFQQHVRNYDPNLFRRGRRRKVEWDKPVGARPATVADAESANQEFMKSLQNWNPR